MARLELVALQPFPLVEPGDDLSALILAALAAMGLELEHDDVLVIAQKVVSKAEDRYVALAGVTPGDAALELAARASKDPRLVQLILDESTEVLRVRPGVIIVQHRNGYVHANAGIDRSNIASDSENPRVLLLPQDADKSALRLRDELTRRTGANAAVVINDSFGRAWRNGTVGVAIGCAGLAPLHNQIGERDLYDNVLEVTEPAVADELSAAASLVMGQAAEGCPVVLARGLDLARRDGHSAELLRDRALDMFR